MIHLYRHIQGRLDDFYLREAPAPGYECVDDMLTEGEWYSLRESITDVANRYGRRAYNAQLDKARHLENEALWERKLKLAQDDYDAVCEELAYARANGGAKSPKQLAADAADAALPL